MSDDAMQPRDETTGDGAEAGAAPPPTPVYDQEFFLKLARPREDTDEARAEARERWNAWRRDPANAVLSVSLRGVDFRKPENSSISFDGFEFGDYADFREAVLGRRELPVVVNRLRRRPSPSALSFQSASFGDFALFSEAQFESPALFMGATFGGDVLFDRVVFNSMASFARATFDGSASFEDSIFERDAVFCTSLFNGDAKFVNVVFGREANFEAARFGGVVDFSANAGEQSIDIMRRSWERKCISGDEFQELDFDYLFRQKVDRFGFDCFLSVNFSRCIFRDDCRFVGRSFEDTADFNSAYFFIPPAIDGVRNVHRIDFTGARVRFAPVDSPDWTTDSSVAVRLRTLRSLVEATKNHDFERDLYIEERKAERGIYFAQYRREKRWGALASHSLWIGVMAVYWALSDYGRSWLRPAVWLGASIPVFDLVYARVLADRQETAVKAAREGVTKSLAGADALAVVKGWQTAEARVRSDYDAVVGQLAVSNAVPFVGPLTVDADAKKFLFCGVWPAAKEETGAGTVVELCRPIPPPGFQFAMISQNLLSILLVFFIGLALRNYFRLK